jgi:hypothetical protein
VVEKALGLRQNPLGCRGRDTVVADLEEARREAGFTDLLGDGMAGGGCARVEGGAEVDEGDWGEQRKWDVGGRGSEGAGEAGADVGLGSADFVEDCVARLGSGRNAGAGFGGIGNRLRGEG